jgi:predicted dehydrogenase
MKQLQIDSSIKMPITPRPIVVIGAGAIIEDAHLPAYQKAGWEVSAIYDLNFLKAESVAAKFVIPNFEKTLDSLIKNAPKNAIFDIAVPAIALMDVLSQIPTGAVVMIQKPFGTTIEEAKLLYKCCIERKLIAAVNFQKRFIPAILAAKRLIDAGEIGELHHIEIRMNIWHPWHLWSFLFGIPRMEMLYHSIHYMDLMRYFLGNPKGVYAKTVKHPKMMKLASTRSNIILDYNDTIQAFITTNHGHEFGTKYQDSFIKWEGTKGAIRHTLGKNINFPIGADDTFEVCILDENEPQWQSFDIEGKWYPDAFMGSMANLMCFVEGSEKVLINSIDSAFETVQLLEAAYVSSDAGGTPIFVKTDKKDDE